MKKSTTTMIHLDTGVFEGCSQVRPELARQIWGEAKTVVFVDGDGTILPLHGLGIRQYFSQILLPRYSDQGEIIGLLGLLDVGKVWLLGADKSGRLEVFK